MKRHFAFAKVVRFDHTQQSAVPASRSQAWKQGSATAIVQPGTTDSKTVWSTCTTNLTTKCRQKWLDAPNPLGLPISGYQYFPERYNLGMRNAKQLFC
jgi:hypothetical protein